MDTAQIKFNITDKTYSPVSVANGISGYMGIFKRGPVGKTDQIFSSWTEVQKVYGGLIASSDDPLIVKRLLERGSKVRICGIRHFTTIGDPTSVDAEIATQTTPFKSGTDELFEFEPKYPGADYNNLKAQVSSGSNGQAGYFDVTLWFNNDGTYTPEVYKNLKITGTPTVAASHYLDDIVKGSELVNVIYHDLSGLTGSLVPGNATSDFAGGTDGTAPTDTDFIGDSAGKNGLHAFDGINDIYAIGSGNTSTALASAGAAYADARKDLQYFFHFDNALKTASAIAAAKDALSINTPFIEFWAGGLIVLDPLTNLNKNINAIGDILGAAALSESTAGPYRSFAGLQRGLIYNALGIVNNFGSVSDLSSLNLLANHQINAVVNDGDMHLSGNFSGQLSTSHLSFNNVVRLIIYMQKSLAPYIKPYIEEPNDIPMWKELYLNAKPFMDSLISPKRAIYGYDWQGDQFVSRIEDIKVNNANDVGLGKYLVNLFVKDITSLQEFTMNIIISESSVVFSTNNNQ